MGALKGARHKGRDRMGEAGPGDHGWNRDVTRPRHPAQGDPWIACQPAGRIRVFSSRVKPRSGGGAALDLKTRIRRDPGKRFMDG
ncbi:hypothetical protein MACH15_15720 [Maricaulis maris]|nr:hypothetical protein MACH15_15720 [Maricaulis maris]